MYYDLILWVTGLPSFVIYGVIGGAMGAIGAVVAWPFSNRFEKASRIVPIIFVVISITITPNIVMPKLDQMGFEAGFMKAAGGLPRKLDDVTVYQSAGVYDDAVNYSFKLTIDIEDKAFTRAALLENIGSMAGCKQVTSIPLRYASKAIYRYETNLGEIVIVPKSSDCR